ncbi:hypothetical protein EYZ11_012094 [Aspergillus tanneri]|uniref:Uncharacterized protein n=1 Tax=Aspergillus tanneri TaxID=1220188 RepID=A0A4S3J6H9_9EURO|nr:uncharacterized protein ATNIH1004_000918 [Aspergillus tanneri]KAA8652018.1 hypothetical protein ATNIH1004_000918 [Aspergillus tanneri]THC88461.1 hypothetical protein EYZ11_012094 [Aspergillus tanneri]
MTVIDLTQDSDSDTQNQIKPIINGTVNNNIDIYNNNLITTPSFFSKLTDRSILPLKRKQEESSISDWSTESFDRPSSRARHDRPFSERRLFSAFQPSTPSPSPGAQEQLKAVSVVIPSPSLQLKKEIASADWTIATISSKPTGLSEEYYPTDAYEKRALKGAYPVAKKKVKRAEIPFQIGAPGPVLTVRPNVGEQLRCALQRKLSAIQGPKVTFAPGDETLLAQFASNFEFINSYKLRKGVQSVPEDFKGGCSCESFCDPDRCSCLEPDGPSERRIIPYGPAADDARFMLLRPDFPKHMIFECGEKCNCKENCWNRVVQAGRTIRLEIFNTGNRGFGLRSPDRIRAGQFIDRYLGEVITKKVADTREEVCTSQCGSSYLFDLDWFEEAIHVVDGRNFGSATRFMNHSCNPNCRMVPMSYDGATDLHLYDLAFFSLKEIPPMTELTFDYNPDAERGAKIEPGAVRCLCGEENCRGQLWPNQRKGTK